MTELERYKAALDAAVYPLNNLLAGAILDHATAAIALKRVENFLNPPPATEEVEVVRWSWGGCVCTFATKEEAEQDATPGFEAVKLTGTDKRPVPQKVKKSVSVEAEVNLTNGGACYNGHLFRDWAFCKFPECHGKRGILTFTWQE